MNESEVCSQLCSCFREYTKLYVLITALPFPQARNVLRRPRSLPLDIEQTLWTLSSYRHGSRIRSPRLYRSLTCRQWPSAQFLTVEFRVKRIPPLNVGFCSLTSKRKPH